MDIYLQNKYTTWYYNIINRAKNRITEGYVEKHHIIPRCIGGSNGSDNLVKLTAREHYICHLLLTQMLTRENKYKMIYAYLSMAHMKSSGMQRDFKINSKLYESIKKQRKFSEETKKKFSIAKLGKTGRKHSDETKKKISEALKNKTGRKHSDETKKKISEALSGNNNPNYDKKGENHPKFGKLVSEETRRKLSELNKGKKFSEEKLRNFYLGRWGKTLKVEQ